MTYEDQYYYIKPHPRSKILDFLKDDGSENIVKIKIRKENHKLTEDEESFIEKYFRLNHFFKKKRMV